LGGTASARDIAVVDRAASDVDVAVAANGAAALGRIGERSHVDVSARLCALSADSRSAVRANALLALRLVGKRCSDERELRALTSDPSSRVRAAAARLLRDVAPQPADVRALRRCVKEEPSGEVAAACTGTAEEVRRGTDEVLVFVVPTGEAQPVSRAPFALVRPDGLIRFGTSDRRGALCEPLVADGELALGPLATVEE
jgi:HEAT repeat protein